MADTPSRAEILIVGAGPTGLVMAIWLTKLGVRVRIVDKLAEPGTTSRALAVQGRTLEFYQQVGLAETIVERGHKVSALNLWVKRERAARVPLLDMGQGLTSFSYPIIFPQDEHERLLIANLAELGVQVERRLELTGFEDNGQRVLATLRKSDGSEERSSYGYLAGCDGARSKVREVLNIGFPGGTYDHLFYVADVEAEGPPMNGELHVDLDEADFLAVFPLKEAGRARLIGSVSDDAAKDHEHLRFEDVRDRAIRNLRVEVTRVNWFSTYRVHHRVALRFRVGRAFLLGDSAHIHSPIGGQGMNTGIGDAVNLAWKLAAALKAPPNITLLDTYEPERIAFAGRLVATTDRVFSGVINPSAMARFVRSAVIPSLAPPLFRVPLMRRLAFRTVSQIAVNYRRSPLSAGKAGKVHGGDRLPWVRVNIPGGDTDNHTPLRSLGWQFHVYGEISAHLKSLCIDHDIPVHVFPWQPDMLRTGLQRDAVYLVRPDGYVALANAESDEAAIKAYLSDHNIAAIAQRQLYNVA
jgi:2-polyprenyl-6-methoxyphenol hydroxylase-like FAD-dependent oxidoreductase